MGSMLSKPPVEVNLNNVSASKTYNLSGRYELLLTYDGDMASLLTSKSVTKNSLTLKVNGKDIKFTNFTTSTSIGLKTSSQEEYTTYSGLEGFYTTFGTNIDWFPSNAKKATGTPFGDTINAGSWGESLPFGSKGVTVDSGTGDDSIVGSKHSDTIKAGAGADTIIGSHGGDSIVGGAGNNVLNYTGAEAGSIYDTYTLTKNETLDIQGLTFTEVPANSQFFRGSLNKNDLMVNSDQGFITVKNFITSDSGATVTIGDRNLNDVVLYETIDPSEHKGKYTGTRLRDLIDGTGYPTSPTGKGLALDGAGGNDTIYGSSNNDTLKGGAGDDYLFGGVGNDSLVDTEGNNFLVGGAGNCSITSGAGDDYLYGGAGNDVLKAGAGDDTVYGGVGDDSVTGGIGLTKAIYDTENFGNDIYTVTKGETLDLSGLTFEGVAKEDRYTKKNNDLIIKSDKGNITVKNILNKDSGAEVTVNGKSLKEEALLVALAGDSTGTMIADLFDASESTKSVKISGKAGNDNIVGSEYDDVLDGGDGNDTLMSNGGKDTIYGGKGNDLIGGSDNTTLIYGGDGDDTIVSSAGDDTIYGGKGKTTILFGDHDTPFGKATIFLTKDEVVNIKGLTKGELSYEKSENGKDLVITDKQGDDKITVIVKDYLKNDMGAKIFVNGKELTNSNDTFLKKVGEEHFAPAQGKANSKYTGTNVGDKVDATSYRSTSTSDTKGVTIDTGLGCDSVVGSKHSDILKLGDGNDTITATDGFDTVYGGKGENVLDCTGVEKYNTTYFTTKDEAIYIQLDTISAFEYEKSSNGNDLILHNGENSVAVKNYLNKDAGADIIVNGRNLKTTNTPVFKFGDEYFNPSSSKAHTKFTGTTLSDSIDASSFTGTSNKGVTIDGGLGNDIIIGSSKNDVLKGGEGDDYIFGGGGNDSIIGGSGVTTAVYTAESFGDDVYTLSKDETVNITGLTFSEVAENERYTRKNNDLIVKSDNGSVTLKNFLGKDIGATVKINDENLSEVAKLGVDYNYFVKNGKLAHNKYTGTSIADVIDAGSISSSLSKNSLVLDGAAGCDSIIGSNGADKLYGGTGDDTIDGRNGNDLVYGGAGCDSVSGGSGNDTLDGGEGDDTLLGGYGSDSILGGAGNDLLYGGNGDDTIIGGAGSDSIYGDAGNNVFKYSLNDGDDTIFYGGENANDTLVFDKGINVNLSYAENGSDLLVTYSGTKGGKQYKNVLTISDYNKNHSLNTITIGKETKTVEEYFAKVNKSVSEFISTENSETWTNLNVGNHTFKYNIDNTGTKGNFGVDVISSGNNYEIDAVETFAYGSLSVVKGEINMGFNSDTSTNHLGMKLGIDGSGELGHIYYRNFLTKNPAMRLTDADHTYNITGYTTAQDLNNSESETNNAVVINTTSDEATTITSNALYNYTNVGGASALTYNYNGGHDVVRTDEQANNDTYNVASALNDNTSLRIYEGGGDSDKLAINATAATNVGIVFNVYQGVGETYVADLSRSVFTVRNSINEDTIKEALAVNPSEVAKGVLVIDNSEENTGIEVLATSDHAEDINEETWYSAITESVATWLASNGFESTEGAIEAHSKDNTIDISGLVNAYKNVDYSALI